MITILVILLIGVAYGIWSGTLRVNTYVYMLKPHLDIGSWRIFAVYPSSLCKGFNSAYLSPENDVLHVLIGSDTINTLWVGLLIENNGEKSFDLVGLNVSLIDSMGEYNITPQVYMYGPVNTGIGNQPYWGTVSCSNLPVDNYTSNFPITVPTGYKLVAWLHLDLNISNTEVLVRVIPGYS
jgi:hypothetical protein